MAVSGAGVLGGLGSFLRTFAGIRDEQARLAEEKRRYEEQKAEEQRRYEQQQELLKRQNLLNTALALRQFGGNVDPALAQQLEAAGFGNLLSKQQPLASRPITNAGVGEMSQPAPSYTFRQTPEEVAAAEDRARAKQTREQIEALIANTQDPVLKQRLTLALGGLNVGVDELTPYDVKAQREKDMARFEHGLRMGEIGAQMQGRETPEERYLREIDRAELLSIADIAQRADLMPADKQAAIQQIRQEAERMRQSVRGGGAQSGVPAVDQSLEDVRQDFQTLKQGARGASDSAILSRMRKDADVKIQDPVERMNYKRALLRLAQELNANASESR